MNQGTVVKYEDLTTYNGVSFAKRIDEAFFPYTGLRTKYPQYFQNHEIRDLNNVPWNIGSIPRVRSSKMTKIKETFKSASPSKSKTHPTATHDEEFKFIGKRNIYFHQNYVSTAHHGLKYRNLNQGLFMDMIMDKVSHRYSQCLDHLKPERKEDYPNCEEQ